MAIGLVLLVAAVVYAQVSVAGQTFYYRYVETVNPDTGARSESNKKGKGAYITFTENSCYESDDKGIASKYPLISAYPLIYQGEQNNLYVFIHSRYDDWFMSFSKDYKRIDNQPFSDQLDVYERTDPPRR